MLDQAPNLVPAEAERPSSPQGESTPKGSPQSGDAWSADHPINVRMTVPLPFGRYYLAVVGGKERRDEARLAAERQRHPLNAGSNGVFLFVAGLLVGFAALSLAQIAAAFLT